MYRILILTLAMGVLMQTAHAAPTLPDFGAATFDATSATINNPYLPWTPGCLWIYEGEIDGEVERIEVLAKHETVNIGGVDSRVVVDTAYVDGVLEEIAEDWYAQDTGGNVWYMGEFVVNFEYDDEGNLIDTNNDGSWTAFELSGDSGEIALPGIIMPASPMVGDSLFQEFAPDVAFDFFETMSTTATVTTDFDTFMDAIVNGEGNLIDGPEIVENKIYAQGIGVVLIQEFDDNGDPEFEVPLIEKRVVPEPGTAVLCLGALALLAGRRRRQKVAQ